jgi:hypothetical protein
MELEETIRGMLVVRLERKLEANPRILKQTTAANNRSQCCAVLEVIMLH